MLGFVKGHGLEGAMNREFSAGLRKSEAVPLGDPVVPVLDGFVG
jgi:hypothetical protein